jgi:hypothetical protein
VPDAKRKAQAGRGTSANLRASSPTGEGVLTLVAQALQHPHPRVTAIAKGSNRRAAHRLVQRFLNVPVRLLGLAHDVYIGEPRVQNLDRAAAGLLRNIILCFVYISFSPYFSIAGVLTSN